MTCGKLGRWDEAVRAYRWSYDVAPNPTTAINLVEALIFAGQAKEVAPFVARLDKMLWNPTLPYSPAERRRLAMMAGYQAIAARLTQDGAEEPAAEKKLLALTAIPNFNYYKPGWSWDEMDAWLAKVDLPDKKKAAVRRIVEEMKGNGPERSTPLLPLAVGAKWTYSQKRSDNADEVLPAVTVEVVAKEKVNDVTCYKLQRQVGATKSDEHVVVRYDGVYRTAVNGRWLVTPYRILALPPAKGRSWTDGGNKLGLLLASSVQTPAGKYEGAWMVREEKDDKAETLVRRTWYAEAVGPVKIETPRDVKGGSTIVLTLTAYHPPR